jgi:hypothetical protein
MAVKTKAQILAEIASLLADNSTGDISALDIRTCLNDITDSYGEELEISGTLTAAQINLSDTTPVSLIAAQGANTIIVLERTIFIRNAGTAYTTTGDLILQYTGGDQQNSVLVNSGLIQTATYMVVQSAPSQSAFLVSANKNAAIEVVCDAAISAGTGTIDYYIKYKVLNLL